MRRDPGFRVIADYCVDHGIPMRRFLDDWDPFSRDVVAATLADQSQRCRDCGEYDETWRDKRGFLLEGGRAPKRVEKTVCGGCRAIELAWNAEDAEERPTGQKMRLVPLPPR